MTFPATRRLGTLLTLTLSLLATRPALSQHIYPITHSDPAYTFYGRGPYRKSVPKPSDILGYEAGETHSTFRDQERVIEAIAAGAKDRVRVVDYGKSSEGRPLRLVILSSPDNIARLDTIRTGIGKLADPRTLANSDEGERLVKNTPCVTWINECIHGSETASFETAMWTIYTLAASENPQITDALKNSVVIVNPVFNPDGHERAVVYYNSVTTGSPEAFAFEKDTPWAIYGRLNHYRFDMNRDKIAQSQSETRQETRAFLAWHPQVFADQHGQPATYFFPPNSQPTHQALDPARVERWTTVFGKANGAAFDRYGWPYVNRETFDFFYPGYLDTFTTLSGAIGMTYETDGGGVLARKRSDETVSTLRDAAAHHFETALATIETAAKNREALLRDFLAYRRSALQPPAGEKLRRIVLTGSDPGRMAELAGLLTNVGVEVRQAKTAFSSVLAHPYLPQSGAKAQMAQFAAGSLIVDLAQPQGHVVKAFLEPDPAFDPAFVKSQVERRDRNEKRNDNEPKDGYEFYDTTAWSLPYAYGLTAYWTEDAPTVDAPLLAADKNHEVRLNTSAPVAPAHASVAYVFKDDRDGAQMLAFRLLGEGFRLAYATRPIRIAGREWPQGTVLALVSRNPDTLHARLTALSAQMGVEVFAANTAYADDAQYGLGSAAVRSLRRPQIAVVADDMVSQTSYGAVWHLLETQAGLGFTPLRLRSLTADVLSKFNVVIFPDGGGYRSALGKDGLDALKNWIGNGNVAIGLGDGGVWMTEKEAAISTAAPVGRDDKPADAEDKAPGKDDKAGDKKPKTPTPLPGAIFRGHLDNTNFLCFGYTNPDIAVPLDGATFLRPTKKGSNVITFDKGPSRLSGFIWPGNTEELLSGTSWLIDEPIGGGHAVIFLSDPTFRGLWVGLRKCFLNGILYGPRHDADE